MEVADTGSTVSSLPPVSARGAGKADKRVLARFGCDYFDVSVSTPGVESGICFAFELGVPGTTAELCYGSRSYV